MFSAMGFSFSTVLRLKEPFYEEEWWDTLVSEDSIDRQERVKGGIHLFQHIAVTGRSM